MSDSQMREFLLSMKLDNQTSIQSIAIAAEVMRSHAITLDLPSSLIPSLIDIVGTGGDKSGSFNISTTTALVVAGASIPVAKHGNRSITSKSGSADVLESLGVRLDLSLEQSATMLQESGFTFMFAKNHHPCMKFITPIRKSIDQKTIFNILGPLTNPAGVQKYLLGVFDKEFVVKMAEVLKLNGAKRAIVVSAAESLDEVSISGITYAAKLDNGKIEEFEIDPTQFGLKLAPFKEILGGDAKENAQILLNILDNTSTDAQRDIVLLNSACAFVSDGIARDIQDGIECAKESIDSKRAMRKLEQIRRLSSTL